MEGICAKNFCPFFGHFSTFDPIIARKYRFTDTQLSRNAPGTGMVLIKNFINQNPSFISYLVTCKMPHVSSIHVKKFFKISQKSHFTLCSIYKNETVTWTEFDNNYGYTIFTLIISIIIINLGAIIRKYFLNGIVFLIL